MGINKTIKNIICSVHIPLNKGRFVKITLKMSFYNIFVIDHRILRFFYNN